MEELYNEFLHDAKDLISDLEKNMFEIDSDKNNLNLIKETFRVMHNLKGTAGMYGFNNVVILTHDLETIYDTIRNETHSITKELIDITLKAIDELKYLLDNSDKIKDKNKFEALLSEITNYSSLIHELPQSNTAKSKNSFYINFTPSEDIFQRGLRIDSVFEEIKDCGEMQYIQHNNSDSFLEMFEKKKCDAFWDIILISEKEIDDIEGIFMFFEDKEYKILKLNTDLTEEAFGTYISEKVSNFEKNKELYDFYFSHNTNDIEKELQNNIEDIKNTIPTTIINKETTDEIVKVYASKLDLLMNLVSELVTSKAQLITISHRLEDTDLIDVVEHIDKLANRFRDNALSIRLISLESLIVDFRRLIRDLSSSLNKEIEFEVEGAATELDKNVINGLKQPLIHIIRNAADHGLESTEERLKLNKTKKGIIKFIAFHSGSDVFIQIQDDGKGIDVNRIKAKAIEKGLIKADENYTDKEIINLIFEPGLSTSSEVSELSGRGVGMDIVRKVIEDLRGEIEISTELGLGTSFTIKLPITLSIINTLHVVVNNENYLIPLSDVKICDNVSTLNTKSDSKDAFYINGELIPFLDLSLSFFGIEKDYKNQKFVLLQKEDKKLAVIIDSIVGEYQAVLKPLGELFKKQSFLSGASIMGDGTVSLVLDTIKLTQTIKNQ